MLCIIAMTAGKMAAVGGRQWNDPSNMIHNLGGSEPITTAPQTS